MDRSPEHFALGWRVIVLLACLAAASIGLFTGREDLERAAAGAPSAKCHAGDLRTGRGKLSHLVP